MIIVVAHLISFLVVLLNPWDWPRRGQERPLESRRAWLSFPAYSFSHHHLRVAPPTGRLPCAGRAGGLEGQRGPHAALERATGGRQQACQALCQGSCVHDWALRQPGVGVSSPELDVERGAQDRGTKTDSWDPGLSEPAGPFRVPRSCLLVPTRRNEGFQRERTSLRAHGESGTATGSLRARPLSTSDTVDRQLSPSPVHLRETQLCPTFL